jgi:zinc/manganese transport system substrate-binding protein
MIVAACWHGGMRRIAVVATVVALAAMVGGCNRAGDGLTGSGQVKVVAAENFWGNLAQQVGGDHVVVTSLIDNPNADPHEFISNVVDQLDVAQAGLAIVNGAGYDEFMAKLLSAAPSSHRTTVTIADILHVTGSDPNPHLWYDAPRLPAVVDAIAAGLTHADPSNAVAFRAGATRTIAALGPIERSVALLRRQFAGTAVAYTERVPGYLLSAAGLKVLTPAGFAHSIEAGTDPSFADTAAMRSVISQHRAKVLVYNSQAASPVTKQLLSLARANRIPVASVAETMPANDSFEAWQLAQIVALIKALDEAKQ